MYRDLRNMWFDCEASHPGYSITVVSGYRTSAKQQTLLRYEIIKNDRNIHRWFYYSWNMYLGLTSVGL